jgi:hemerythrin
MLAWSDDFATGLETIDKQHRMLIDHINRLEEILATPQPTPAEIQFAHSLVQFLEAYADRHFRVEEQCMESYRCPAHAENQLMHAQFLEFFDRFKKQFKEDGFQVLAFQELHHAMSSWITGHILRIDTQLKSCSKH